MNGGVFDENGFDIKTAEGITSDEMDVGGGNAKLEENGEGLAGDLEDGDLVEVDLWRKWNTTLTMEDNSNMVHEMFWSEYYSRCDGKICRKKNTRFVKKNIEVQPS